MEHHCESALLETPDGLVGRVTTPPPEPSAWKSSRYNFWGSARSGAPLLLNGRTGALLELDTAEATRLRTALEAGLPVDDEFAEVLLDLGFLVPADLDEIELLQRRAEDGCRGGNGTLELIISPTYACNFRCKYCYVEHRQGAMTRESETAILRHVQRVLEGYSMLEVSWFGGEPLLCLDTIERMTRELRDLACARKVQFRSFATTNGYLLDTSAVRRLQDACIEYLHVTVDGSRETHDRLRVRADGSGTYDVILANLLAALELSTVLKFTLRSNVDRDNVTAVYDLMNAIPPVHRHRIQLSVRPIRLASGEPDDDVRAEIGEVASRAVELGFLDYQVDLPMGKSGHCFAEKEGNYYIDPAASLYSCSPLKGKADVFVGRLRPDGSVDFAPEYSPRHESRPFPDRCRACDYLCFCMGGCPLNRESACDESCKAQYANIGTLIGNLAEASSVAIESGSRP